jgi:hypothetical protein
MSDRLRSYTAYGVGCAVAWGAILGSLARSEDKEQLRKVLPVFAGWWLGWTSATIGRYWYPPPKSRPPWLRAKAH